MKLKIKNLGPVHSAELDLSKNLIVLVGPNNMGKTYLAWAVYSLARLERLNPPPGVEAWAEQTLRTKHKKIPKTSLMPLVDEFVDAASDALLRQLPADFAAPQERFSETRVKLELGAEDNLNTDGRGAVVSFLEDGEKRYLLALRHSHQTFDISIEHRTEGSSVPVEFDELDEETQGHCCSSVAQLIVFFLRHILLDSVREVLPVERLALSLFARELAAWRTELVDELLIEGRFGDEDPRATLRERAGLYPRVIRDALQVSIRNSRTVSDPPFADLADELEEQVLGGRVSSVEDEIEFVPHGTSPISLRLHQTASVVKSLVSLVLFLRYRATPGTRLIIDEPELNLHPDNQRRVARILVKAISRGLKIMMSTHSDYFVRELNNMIMLGQESSAAQEMARTLGYEHEMTLQGQQLAVYLVNEGLCRAVEVTESGFEVETIDAEIHKLNSDSQQIYQQLFCE